MGNFKNQTLDGYIDRLKSITQIETGNTGPFNLQTIADSWSVKQGIPTIGEGQSPEAYLTRLGECARDFWKPIAEMNKKHSLLDIIEMFEQVYKFQFYANIIYDSPPGMPGASYLTLIIGGTKNVSLDRLTITLWEIDRDHYTVLVDQQDTYSNKTFDLTDDWGSYFGSEENTYQIEITAEYKGKKYFTSTEQFTYYEKKEPLPTIICGWDSDDIDYTMYIHAHLDNQGQPAEADSWEVNLCGPASVIYTYTIPNPSTGISITTAEVFPDAKIGEEYTVEIIARYNGEYIYGYIYNFPIIYGPQ